ncbi:Collagen alpha-3(VI) chain [Manis javanica]|nr:Collagen alpha-3(VI) chain [Manis javanica]
MNPASCGLSALSGASARCHTPKVMGHPRGAKLERGRDTLRLPPHSPGTGTQLAQPETGQEEATGWRVGARDQDPKGPGLQLPTLCLLLALSLKK